MEREQDECRAYRARLLDALRTRPDRERAEEPDVLQVFANQETVGTLDCDAPDSTLILAVGEPVRTLEVRTASGLLVGGLSAPELGVKRTQCRMGRFLVEIDVHNDENRGSARVSCRAAQPSALHDGQVLGSLAAAARSYQLRHRLALVAQVVLASAVMFLVADRLTDRFSSGSGNLPVMADASAPNPAVLEGERSAAAAREAELEAILKKHETAMRDEFDHRLQASFDSAGIEQQRLRSQVAALASSKDSLRREVAALKSREIHENLQASMQKFEHRLRDVQNAAEVERARLQDEIKALAGAKETMNREIVALKKREVEQGLKQQAVVLARILSPQETDRKVAEIAEVTVLPGPVGRPAEARGEGDAAPFTFWVSFQDGTSEENIERLIRTIQGRKGPINAGWYNVEVKLPKPQTPEELFETLKREKIVKSVTRSRDAAPPEQTEREPQGMRRDE